MKAFIVIVLLGLALAGSGQAVDSQWVVVTAPKYRSALAPLIDHRRSEGFSVTVLDSTNILSAAQIRATNGEPLQVRLRQLYRNRAGTTYVLLVGATGDDPASAVDTVVPPLVGIHASMKGEPSDASYVDFELIDKVALGRFPVRTADEARVMVGKTLALERTQDTGDWRDRLVLIGGNPGGGAIIDIMFESVARRRFEKVHASWTVRTLFNSAQSRYYVPSARMHEASLELLEAGGLFALYLGHAAADGFWSGNSNFLSRNDWASLRIKPAPLVLFTTGCSVCSLGGKEGEGAGLAAIRNPTGPAAVIGSHQITYTAPGLLAVDGLLRCFSNPPSPARLADYWIATRLGLARGPIDDRQFKLYDQFDGSNGKTPLEEQRLEHLEMWMLLGDPALRLPVVPVDIRLDAIEPIAAGRPVAIRGTVPGRLSGAMVRVTLERSLSGRPADLEKLPPSTPEMRESRERVAMANYQRANSFIIAQKEIKAQGNAFECQLDVPEKIKLTNLVVRARAVQGTNLSLGVTALKVRLASTNQSEGVVH